MANFGYESNGGGTAKAIGTYGYGCLFTISENGTAQSITWYITNQTVGILDLKVAIYDSALNLLASGEKNDIPEFFDGWATVPLDTNPDLTKDASYWLVGRARTAANCYYASVGGWDYYYSSTPTYLNFPADPLAGTFSTGRKFSVYCTYEEAPPPTYIPKVIMVTCSPIAKKNGIYRRLKKLWTPPKKLWLPTPPACVPKGVMVQ
ncbi:hypothetical protein ES703_46945 [subsurface metagenome]